MYKILLVCTGNTCRSPMLECLLRAKVKSLNKKLEVRSAGLYVTDEKVSSLSRKALKEQGLVIRHKPTQLTQAAIDRANTVITMTDQQKSQLYTNRGYSKVFSMRETVGENVPDPYGGSLEDYIDCARRLNVLSDIIIDKLEKAGKI